MSYPPDRMGDHLLEREHGGPTDLANLVLLCRRHHVMCHEGGWQLARGPDGTLVATAEDEGRHNAVDKIVGGRLLLGDWPLSERCAAGGEPGAAAVGGVVGRGGCAAAAPFRNFSGRLRSVSRMLVFTPPGRNTDVPMLVACSSMRSASITTQVPTMACGMRVRMKKWKIA